MLRVSCIGLYVHSPRAERCLPGQSSNPLLAWSLRQSQKTSMSRSFNVPYASGKRTGIFVVFPSLLTRLMAGTVTEKDGRGRRARVYVTEKEDSVVNIEGVTGDGWKIRGITGGKDRCIVITGMAPDDNSHITLIDIKGKNIKQTMMEGTAAGYRYCHFMSQFKIATASWPQEIGIYDIRGDTYRKANIRDIISTWPPRVFVWCVTVVHANNHIIVGGICIRDVYVFDQDLKYINTITLPEMAKDPIGMAVHEGSLLVCSGSGRACAVTMEEGSAYEIKYEFHKPDVGRDSLECEPWNVCTGQHGYIYMLWKGIISGRRRNILAQYSQDGRGSLQTRLLDCEDDADSITTVETDQREKLLLATETTGKLITYGLGE